MWCIIVPRLSNIEDSGVDASLAVHTVFMVIKQNKQVLTFTSVLVAVCLFVWDFCTLALFRPNNTQSFIHTYTPEHTHHMATLAHRKEMQQTRRGHMAALHEIFLDISTIHVIFASGEEEGLSAASQLGEDGC